MTLTLRSRLTLVHTAVSALLLVALGVVSYRVLAYQLDADLSARLAELTTGLHGYLRVGGAAPALVFDPSDPAEAAFVDEATRYYQVFDAESGQVLMQSDGLKPLGLDFTPTEVRQYRGRLGALDVQTDFGRLRLSNSVISAAGRDYLLQVGLSLAPMDRTLHRFLVLLLAGVPAALLAAFLFGRWMARVALRPLAQLAAAARGIDIEDLRRRLPVRHTGDELDDLATAFNETLERLEHAIGEMRQFSTALAHELRTPLAALRGDIEMAMLHAGDRDDLGRRVASELEEIDKLKRLIDQILMLARAEAGEIALARDAVDLGALAASLVDQVEPVAVAKGIVLRRNRVEGAMVRGDAAWLERLVLNLLDNAIKFTPAGGRVVVDVMQERPYACLAVQDTGVGIEPEIRSRIFERFYRADPARSPGVAGVGLGLSLAKWIVERHHGRIDVDSEPGQGSTFTVRLPLAAS